MNGIRHMIECVCDPLWTRKLPEGHHLKNVKHQFCVFSVVGDDGVVEGKFAKCDNCGLVHYVDEIGSSKPEKSGRDQSGSIPTIEEVSLTIGDKIKSILDANHCDLPTYEHVAFIIENAHWGESIVISSEKSKDNVVEGKRLVVIGQNLCKVVTFVESY